jgi:hypothetical protein
MVISCFVYYVTISQLMIGMQFVNSSAICINYQSNEIATNSPINTILSCALDLQMAIVSYTPISCCII